MKRNSDSFNSDTAEFHQRKVISLSSETEFHEEMESLHHRTGQATGYWPNYFLRSVRKEGGLEVAKKLLTRGRKSTGFDKLVEASRIDLSVEFIADSRRFRHLFTEEELRVARERLSQLVESAVPTTSSSFEPRTLGEVDDRIVYREGAVERVLVNRFERDPKARAACIRHHGVKCKACGLDFEERYGEAARGFIHVHHTRPLSRMRASNRVDPKRDLVPVCPNCHAVLHFRDPPYDIEQLRVLIQSQER